MPERWIRLLAVVLVGSAVAFGLDRPVDFDETNFLRLAEGALRDPWRPHEIWINWQGTGERAFDVLSNPPAVAWWLAPTLQAPIWLQRVCMLPWGVLAVFGARMLGQRFGAGNGATLLAAPIVVLSATALLPDMPLYACVLAGMGGFIRAADAKTRAWPWAILAGCGALFRYSGVAILPLLPLYALLHRRAVIPSLAAGLPLALLAAHDLDAYGAVHLLAMGQFQSVANTWPDVFHKLVAAICMLGGAAALPIFPWGRRAMLGAAIGALCGVPFGVLGVGFGALGGAALGGLANTKDRPPPDALFLALWAFGGLIFLLGLRFTATRYWMPFLPPVLLAMPSRWEAARQLTASFLAFLLCVEDARHATADATLAKAVAAQGTGTFTGHWGWQYSLEHAGWTPLNSGDSVPRGTLVAIPHEPWPQAVEVRCDHVIFEGEAPAWWAWWPRGYTAAGHANLHANWIAGVLPVRTVAPWWFGTDPYDRARICLE